MSTQKTNGVHRSFLNTEAVILGFLLGGLLVLVAGRAWLNHEHMFHSPVEETLWTAVYLTALVAFVGFKFPTFFADKPRVAVFFLCFFAGHISLLFDSFAVILLFSTLTFLVVKVGDNLRFNAFAVKAIAAFNALTVGGGFYLGELWGLPYYISSGFDNPTAGLPLLLVLTPYCILTSLAAALLFPLKVEKVPFDREQISKAILFITGLVLLIWTHNPFLCMGLLLLYSAVIGKTRYLVSSTLNEIGEGAGAALGLILTALLIQQVPEVEGWISQTVRGPLVLVLAAISSPFAGAMVPGTADPAQFYVNLSWIMLGAPLFVSSSLVAIVVFKEQLKYEDLPKWMRRFPGAEKRGVMQEAVAYTLLMIPLTVGLGLLLWIANTAGIFEQTYYVMQQSGPRFAELGHVFAFVFK